MKQDTFISFEGGEGTGKTTQVQLLEASFRAANIDVLATREPGGSTGAEEIRALLVQGAPIRWSPLSELFLHLSARQDHVDKLVAPALERGTWIISDRYIDSTIVYQVYGQKLKYKLVDSLNRLSCNQIIPKLTLILDIDPDIGLARSRGRNSHESRYESFDLKFHRRIRDGFLKIGKRYSQRCQILNAARAADDVHNAVIECVNTRFGLNLFPTPMSKMESEAA